MATLTLEYNTQNNMAQRIVEIILAMDGLFKVKTAVAEPKATAVAVPKQTAAAFLNKWAGKFSVGEKETDDARYNYLVEKYA